MELFRARFKVPKHLSQKNRKTIRKNRKSGKLFIGGDDGNLHLKNLITTALLRKKIVNKIFEPIDKPVNLQVNFYYMMKRNGEPEKRIIDLDNLYSGIQDALQRALILKDDNLVFGHSGSKRIHHEGDREVEIILTEYPSYSTTKDGFHYIDINDL